MSEDGRFAARRPALRPLHIASALVLLMGCFRAHEAPSASGGVVGTTGLGAGGSGSVRPIPMTASAPHVPTGRVSYTVTLTIHPVSPQQTATEVGMTWTLEPTTDDQLRVMLSAFGEASQAALAYDAPRGPWRFAPGANRGSLSARTGPTLPCADVERLSFTRLSLRFPDAMSLAGAVEGVLTHGDEDEREPFTGSVLGVLDVRPPRLRRVESLGAFNPFDGLSLIAAEALPAATQVRVIGDPEPILLQALPAQLPSEFRTGVLLPVGVPLRLEVLPRLTDLAGNVADSPLPTYQSRELPGAFRAFKPSPAAVLEGSASIVEGSSLSVPGVAYALLLDGTDARFSARLIVPPGATKLAVVTRALYREAGGPPPGFRLRMGVPAHEASTHELQFASAEAGVTHIDSQRSLGTARESAYPLLKSVLAAGEVYLQVDHSSHDCGAAEVTAAVIQGLAVR